MGAEDHRMGFENVFGLGYVGGLSCGKIVFFGNIS